MENFEKLKRTKVQGEKMKKEMIEVLVVATLVWSGAGYAEELPVDNTVAVGENTRENPGFLIALNVVL